MLLLLLLLSLLSLLLLLLLPLVLFLLLSLGEYRWCCFCCFIVIVIIIVIVIVIFILKEPVWGFRVYRFRGLGFRVLNDTCWGLGPWGFWLARARRSKKNKTSTISYPRGENDYWSAKGDSISAVKWRDWTPTHNLTCRRSHVCGQTWM